MAAGHMGHHAPIIRGVLFASPVLPRRKAGKRDVAKMPMAVRRNAPYNERYS
jgi:hypothetical protein